MRVTFSGSRMYFGNAQDAENRSRSVDLRDAFVEIDTRGDHVVLDLTLPSRRFRSVTKYDSTGKAKVIILPWTEARIEIGSDNRSYSVDGVTRTCIGPIWHVSGSEDGELVVLDPSSAPEPARNLYRYNVDGSLRWQMGSREYRPHDLIYWGEFSADHGVIARASMNGWTGQVDDTSGMFLGVFETNVK